MIYDTAPGSFPLTQRKVKKENYINRLKTYFHRTEKQLATEKKCKNSKWNNFWKKKPERVEISNSVAVGTTFALNVPITISHYHSKSDGSVSSQSGNSIVQQSVILPPFQIYGFMFLLTLLLLVVAFALLQVHRTISIVELGVEGIKHILTNFSSLFSFLLGLK